MRRDSTVWWWGNLMFLGFLCLALAVCLTACTGLWQSTKAAALPAGGAAGGALAGSVVGPAGTVVGAGLGAVVGHALGENAELRSGSLQGEGARDDETDRLKSLLMLTKGDLQLKERALTEAQTAASWARTWWLRLLLAGLVTRNLANFPPLAKALLARRWALSAHWLLHILIWPIRPKASS